MKALNSLSIALLAAILTACTPATKKPDSAPPVAATPAEIAKNEMAEADLSPTASIEQRSEQRWKLIIAGEFNKAFSYLSPGYRQTRVESEYAQSMATRPVRWTDAEYQDHTCSSADVCTVKILINFDLDLPIANVGQVASLDVLEEKWIRVDGVWYFLPTSSGGTGSGR